MFKACGQIDPHQFVTTFFGINTGHYSQVYRLTKSDKIGVALILNLQRLFLLFLLVVLAIITVIFVAIFFVAPLSENFRFSSLVFLFVLLPIWVEFKDVQTVLHVNLII